jgi:hypothetical protein
MSRGAKKDMRMRAWPAVAVLWTTVGCGSVAVTRLTKESDYRDGIRFYRPAPYLLVTAKAAGERQAAIVWLPKKDEEYVVRVRSGVSAVEAKLGLQDGWNLTEYGESRDPKTSDLVGGALGLVKTIEGVTATPGEGLEPGLYALDFDAATGGIRSLRRIPIEAGSAR